MRVRSFVPCAAFAGALGLTAPALASSYRHQDPRSRGEAAALGARTAVPTVKSTTFAGYRINHKINHQDGHASVTATVVVPTLKCTKANRAIAASVGIYEDSNTKFSSANLFIGCVNGKARYFPFLTVRGQEQNFRKVAAYPGDMVALEVAANSTETSVEVSDQTHMFNKRKAGAPLSRFAGYPWLGDVTWSANHRVEGVPNFGEIEFSSATIGGSPIGPIGGLQRDNRYNPTKTKLQIETGNLGSDEESFSTAFRHP